MLRFRLSNLFVASSILLAAAGTVPAAGPLAGRVIDESGVAVAGARITLSGSNQTDRHYAVSDEAGRFRFAVLDAGTYQVKVEKKGYYAFVSQALPVGDRSPALEVVLNHRTEYEEKVFVVYSVPAIDPEQTSAQTTLTASEILDLPVPSTHDFHSSLPLIPGVIKDNKGRIHINGGGEDQVLYTLDGFDVANPASGRMENRISVDALRAVRVESSRYSAEHGKGSAGILALESATGDDRRRFSATNFVPSFEFQNGLVLNDWNPRASFSGPIVEGRAWYENALDLQYNLNTVEGLPSGENTNRNVFGSNLSRFQFHLTNRNVLTTSFLFNFRESRYLGLSVLDPVETTQNRSERSYFFNIKDQAYLKYGWVVETGFAINQLRHRVRPLGSKPYEIHPQGRSGNFFESSSANVRREQWLLHFLAPPRNWHGRHNLKFGLGADAIRDGQFAQRNPIEVYRGSGTRSQLITFSGKPKFIKNNLELSGFVQDRWSPGERVLLEAGMRLDWDQILRSTMWSPRLSVTWSPTDAPDSKLSAGIGVFYDATNLGLLTRQLDQVRSDTFFDQDGTSVIGGPISSVYLVDERHLQPPRSLNWSLGWEQKLPCSFFLRTNFISKKLRHGWTYSQIITEQQRVLRLQDRRRDSYHFLEWKVSRTFEGKYPWMLSYARSSARTSAVIDFSQDSMIRSGQGSGPVNWDTPNRLISWGTLPTPLLEKYMLSYFLEWHSGFPFNVVDEEQRLVGLANNHRLADYFSLNLHMECRFRLLHHLLALRAGFNNITGHRNPDGVDNNISSPNFGSFNGGQGRVFTVRIRFLGRK